MSRKRNATRLASLINDKVASRSIPDDDLVKPSVILKVDLEGRDLDVIPDLILHGSLRHIDVLAVSFREDKMKSNRKKERLKALQESLETLQRISGDFELLVLLKEEYSKSEFEPPKCE